jgi:hypothetical protein
MAEYSLNETLASQAGVAHAGGQAALLHLALALAYARMTGC